MWGEPSGALPGCQALNAMQNGLDKHFMLFYRCVMKLETWMDADGRPRSEIAHLLGVHVVTLYKWGKGIVIPRANHMAAIEKLTKGEVMAQDFYDLAK